MKGVLSKYKSKEEGYQSVQQSTLQSKIEGLAAEIAEVEVLIQQAEATTLEAKEAKVDELEKRLAEEQDKVSALIEKVTTSETLIRAGTPAKEALEEAAKIKKKFDASVEKLNQCKAFQETLKLPLAAIPEVAEFEKHFGIRHKLW
jgi:chromosome segregation ATPase